MAVGNYQTNEVVQISKSFPNMRDLINQNECCVQRNTSLLSLSRQMRQESQNIRLEAKRLRELAAEARRLTR